MSLTEDIEKTPAIDNDESDDKETLCGTDRWTPSWIQCMANIQTFTFFYSGVSMLTQTLTSYINSQVPSIEKHFGLSSTESGVLMGFNDMGFLLCSLFISSLARYVHIPRFLFYCTVLYGVSGVLCSLPHFFDTTLSQSTLREDVVTNGTKILQRSSGIPICNKNKSAATEDCFSEETETLFKTVSPHFKRLAFGIIAFGMMVQGIGKAPRAPFVTVYVDDNVEKRKTGFYTGIITTAGFLGPALGFFLGGYFSKLYVTLEDVDITPKDARFIGAWWLGFLVFGISTLLLAIPIFFFPRRFKWTMKKNLERSNEVVEEEKLITLKEKAWERLLSYWRVMNNPLYISVLIVNSNMVLGQYGYFSFLSKYIQSQYGKTLWEANLILGATNLTSLALGSMGGGILTRKVRMIPRNTFGLLFGLFIIQNVFFAFGFFLGCEQPKVVGPESIHGSAALHMSNCSLSCECDSSSFFPICGSNGVNYHSPCYAGCPENSLDNTVLGNCSCIPGGEAAVGLCDADCKLIYPWFAASFISTLFGNMKIILSFIAKIRSVEDRDKSTAMGLQAFLLSLIAFMPSPIIFGKVIDTTCMVWQSTCSGKGACLHYNNAAFRFRIHALTMLFYTIAASSALYGFLKTRKWKEWRTNRPKSSSNGNNNDTTS